MFAWPGLSGLLPVGRFTFLRDTDRDLFGGAEENRAATIQREVEAALGDGIRDLCLRYGYGRVTLVSEVRSPAMKAKAALVAGNVRGVSHVDTDCLRVGEHDEQGASGR